MELGRGRRAWGCTAQGDGDEERSSSVDAGASGELPVSRSKGPRRGTILQRTGGLGDAI